MNSIDALKTKAKNEMADTNEVREWIVRSDAALDQLGAACREVAKRFSFNYLAELAQRWQDEVERMPQTSDPAIVEAKLLRGFATESLLRYMLRHAKEREGVNEEGADTND